MSSRTIMLQTVFTFHNSSTEQKTKVKVLETVRTNRKFNDTVTNQ